MTLRKLPFLFMLLLMLTLATTVSVAVGPATADASGDATIPPTGDTYYQSYADWGDEWWNWAVKAPAHVNPLLDTTGQFGHGGQGGPVWFLAGTSSGSVERSLTVPPQKAFFFPLINSAWWTPEDGQTEADVRAIANYVADEVDDLFCELDGMPCTPNDLFTYRAESEPGGFTLRILPNSLLAGFGYDPGDRAPAVSDGYWVMLAPLSPGEHELHFGGEASSLDFAVEATYHLAVTGQQ